MTNASNRALGILAAVACTWFAAPQSRAQTPGQGTTGVGWRANTNQHPGIGGELYRFKIVDGAGHFGGASATFCPNPPGDTFNVTNGIIVTW